MINDYHKISRSRLLKYEVMRRVPGRIGKRYRKNYPKFIERNSIINAFELACRECKGKIAIDLGANLGAISIRMARTASKVFAFEPDPWTAEKLRENVSAMKNVEVIEAAASVAEREMQLFRHREFSDAPEQKSQSSSLLASHRDVASDVSAMTVQVMDFVKFLRQLPEDVGVLKVDIEGAEIELLNALFDSDVLTKVDYIFCETHEAHFPKMQNDFAALMERAQKIQRPVINLDWF